MPFELLERVTLSQFGRQRIPDPLAAALSLVVTRCESC